jgi:hypothetical protein
MRNGTISKSNVHDILHLPKEFLNDVNISEVQVLKYGRAIENICEENLIKISNLDFYNGYCPFVTAVPILSPNGNLYACCCYTEHNCLPENNFSFVGNIKSDGLSNLIEKMNNSLVYNILYSYGPYRLLKLVNEYYPEINTRQEFLGTCDVCTEIFNNKRINDALNNILADKFKPFISSMQ